MEVRSLIPNRVQIAERDLALEKAKQTQPMNIFNKIFGNPSILWTLATILVVACIVISLGVKWAAGLLAIWVTISLIAYFAHRSGARF